MTRRYGARRPPFARRMALLAVLGVVMPMSGCLASPKLNVTTVVSAVDHPWDVGFANGTMVYTERIGRISAFVGGQKRLLAAPADVVHASEAGMMGLAIDPAFSTNRYIYTCFASTLGGPNNDVRVVRWTVDAGFTTLTNRTDIVTGAPVNTAGQLGRHSGCRPRFGPDGVLWIGTGDSATGSVPQSPTSLGGRILRVNRDGSAAAGNPGGALDPRIWSYGHRNVQGLAFRDLDGLAVSTEHGPDRDDELNRLTTGNFGWNPLGTGGTYDEAVSMTDLNKFPSAVQALWSSGTPTVAPSGADFLPGSGWGKWNRALAVALLKGQKLLVFKLDSQGEVVDMGEGISDQGRLRSVVVGPGSAMYLTTDNGGGTDKILKVLPK